MENKRRNTSKTEDILAKEAKYLLWRFRGSSRSSFVNSILLKLLIAVQIPKEYHQCGSPSLAFFVQWGRYDIIWNDVTKLEKKAQQTRSQAWPFIWEFPFVNRFDNMDITVSKKYRCLFFCWTFPFFCLFTQFIYLFNCFKGLCVIWKTRDGWKRAGKR